MDSLVSAARDIPSIDVWLVDNGSCDNSVVVVREKYGNELRILTFQRNMGYGGACNLAYTYVRELGLQYRYYACVNNDVVIYKEGLYDLMYWLNILERMFPKGFIVAPILVNGYDGKLDFGGYFVDNSGGAWPLRLVTCTVERLTKVLRLPLPISYADGAFMVFHRAVIEKIGLFDYRFFLYGEDVEVCLRAWRKGIPSFLVPVIVGRHHRSASTRRIKHLQLYMQVRNRVYVALRYFGLYGLVKALAWYTLYPLRLIDMNNPIVKNVMREIGLDMAELVREVGGATLTVKTILRAVIDAIRWAKRGNKEKADIEPPVLRPSLVAMVSTKALLNEVQAVLLGKLHRYICSYRR